LSISFKERGFSMAVNIERDAVVEASDGVVGRVKHVIVDRETREVTDLVVERDGDEWLIPIRAVASAGGNRVRLRGSRAELSAGAFDRRNYHAVDDERAVAESQDRALRGGDPLKGADDDAVVINEVEDARRTPAAPNFRYQPRSTPTTAERQTVELREEELRARKEMVEAGEVEIRKDVVTEQRTLEVPITREEVVVERHPIEGRRVSDRPIGETESIRVPVREEEVTVEKRPVVREEIEIGKRRVEETEQVSGTVRREEARIEREGDVEVGGLDVEQDHPSRDSR
jgi:uncharacterized protein (TIGR02271 family)